MTNMLDNTLLRKARQANNLTIQDLANKTGLSTVTLYRLEDSPTDVRLSTLYKLSEALQCRAYDLLPIEPVKPNTSFFYALRKDLLK